MIGRNLQNGAHPGKNGHDGGMSLTVLRKCWQMEPRSFKLRGEALKETEKYFQLSGGQFGES